MTVTCPHCENRYLLPPSLMGPGGARVRCPGCRRAFMVGAGGAVTAIAEAAGEREESPAAKAAPPEPPAPAPAITPVPEVAAHLAEILLRARVPEATEPHAAPAPVPVPEDETPANAARRLLAEMDAEHGPSEIAFAAEQGTMFFAHGPRLMEAFDQYKRIAGRAASAAVFREAVRERWGVDLTPAELPR